MVINHDHLESHGRDGLRAIPQGGQSFVKRSASGGRTWWAHFEFTRINIEPIILRKKIEELRRLGAFLFTKDAWRGRIAGAVGEPYAVLAINEQP